ncbi:hypothetical protein HAZT_HAZT002670 [Hyalella azteca]|uniref:Cadherin domain-containing protein n=1 Tax=Hyalella azteca TaxID=294128 RepID=A0A6A0H7A3_HYAAZ|nr:hypothetical protein HAZT_HAZT002670 [Hyalella azteca]
MGVSWEKCRYAIDVALVKCRTKTQADDTQPMWFVCVQAGNGTGALSFFVRSVRGRRNTEALAATLGEAGWGPDTQGDELFVVNRTTGVLSTAGPLDRELQSQYEVQVIVSDGSLWTVTPVYVTVSDVNDNAPQFLESLYRVTVPARPAGRRRLPLLRSVAAGLGEAAKAG